jgi:D-alanine-D-alanine ligase
MRLAPRWLPGTEKLPAYVRAYIAYHALTNVALWYSVWAKLLLDRGASLAQLGLLNGVYRIAAGVLELPSGVWADRFGRRNSLALSGSLFAGALCLFAWFDSLPLRIASMVLWAGADSFEGAASAYIWDELKQRRRSIGRRGRFGFADKAGARTKAAFRDAESRSSLWALAAAGLGCFAGFAAYRIDPPLPFLLNAALALGSALFVLTCFRNDRPGAFNESPVRSATRSGFGAALGVFRDWKVMRVVLYRLPAFLLLACMAAFLQPLVQSVAILSGRDWVFYLAYLGFGVAGAYLCSRAHSSRGFDWLALKGAPLGFVVLGLAASFAGPLWGLGAALLFQFLHQLQMPATDAMIHERLASNIRAASISAVNLSESLLAGGLTIVAGLVAAESGVGRGILVAAGVCGVLLASVAFADRVLEAKAARPKAAAVGRLKVLLMTDRLPEDAEGLPADEVDTAKQAGQVADSLRKLGHEVALFRYTGDHESARAALEGAKPSLVFHAVESAHAIAASLLAAAMRTPQTGAGPRALLLTEDKLLTKALAASAGIPVAAGLSARDLRRVPRPNALGGFIVKARRLAASIGLDPDSMLADATPVRLLEAIEERERRFGTEFFAERFLPGAEYKIGLLEIDGRPAVLPIREIRFDRNGSGFLHYSLQWDPGSPEQDSLSIRFLDPGSPKSRQLSRLALTAWEAFQMRGYGRVDVRDDEGGNPHLLEVNANCGIADDSGFFESWAHAGGGYDEMIRAIVSAGLAGAAA